MGGGGGGGRSRLRRISHLCKRQRTGKELVNTGGEWIEAGSE